MSLGQLSQKIKNKSQAISLRKREIDYHARKKKIQDQKTLQEIKQKFGIVKKLEGAYKVLDLEDLDKYEIEEIDYLDEDVMVYKKSAARRKKGNNYFYGREMVKEFQFKTK